MDSMRQHITDEFENPSPNGVYGTALKKDITKLCKKPLKMKRSMF